jgi:hypothetical protein
VSPLYPGEHLGFDVERVYYIYDVPDDESRGEHAHKRLQQLLIAVRGSLHVLIDDGYEKKSVVLDRADCGLYIPGLIWRRLSNFSPGGVCLVLASSAYDEADYIRNYDEFIRAKRQDIYHERAVSRLESTLRGTPVGD